VKDIISSYPLVARVTLFDVYAGEQIPRGKKSLAFRVMYQSPTHTLSDEQVEEVGKEILARLSRELGVSLRS